MLSKLMKYEFKATGRVFLPLFAALIVISAVSRIFMQAISSNAPQVIGVILAVMLMFGIFIITIILTIQRFWKNLLSEEGYLMMTLPVKTDKLILSKLFVASTWSVTSFAIVVVSIIIMASGGISWDETAVFFKQISVVISEAPALFYIFVIEIIVFVMLAIFGSILCLYFCMSLSQLVNRRRVLFTFGVFVGLSTVLQIAAAVLISAGTALELHYGWFTNLNNSLAEIEQATVIVLVIIVLEALLCAAYYAVTRYMLKNRLNLQ